MGWRSVERETVIKNVRIFHQELSVGFEIIQAYHPNKVPLEKVEPLSLNYAKGGLEGRQQLNIKTFFISLMLQA